MIRFMTSGHANSSSTASTANMMKLRLSFFTRSGTFDQKNQGTGSGPYPPQGWHREMRFTANHPPFSAP